MAYELNFSKGLTVSEPDIYINECCWGGDLIRDELLPLVSARFHDIQTEQEDWGWFIWFKKVDVQMAIDIDCDEPSSGKFRIRLSAIRKSFFGFRSQEEPAGLEYLLELVTRHLQNWVGSVEVEAVD